MVRDLRDTPPQSGVDRVYAPGERSHARWLEAQRDGVAIPEKVLAQIRELAGAGTVAPRAEQGA
jgi:LDH2 family malate/lactate/ureidoglycolate dehydrogenase